MDVNPFIIKWYFSFLTNRTQQVKVNKKISNPQDISTGAPQGCVSSPVLFTLYTNSCVRNNSNTYIVKFSDDTAILSLLYKDQDISSYCSEINQFIEWCDANHLIVNVKKTEEMIFDPSQSETIALYIVMMFLSHKCPHINILVFTLIVL